MMKDSKLTFEEKYRLAYYLDNLPPMGETCEDCKGSGQVNNNICSSCNGKGII